MILWIRISRTLFSIEEFSVLGGDHGLGIVHHWLVFLCKLLCRRSVKKVYCLRQADPLAPFIFIVAVDVVIEMTAQRTMVFWKVFGWVEVVS